MQHWHVIWTKPRMEYRVADALEARGVEVFASSIEYRGLRGNLLNKPFFPSYIFARYDWESAELSMLQWTPGLREVLGFDQGLARLDDETIKYLRQRIEGIDGDEFVRMKPGERVRLKRGPFRDYEAIFDRRLNGQERATVLLDILGRRTQVQVDARDLERIA